MFEKLYRREILKWREMIIYLNVCFRVIYFLINRMNMWEIRKFEVEAVDSEEMLSIF